MLKNDIGTNRKMKLRDKTEGLFVPNEGKAPYIHYAKYMVTGSGLVDHDIEIGIEVTKEDAEWLYQNCIVQGNEHSHVNLPSNKKGQKYVSNRCLSYNSIGIHCYHNLSKQESDKLLYVAYGKK